MTARAKSYIAAFLIFGAAASLAGAWLLRSVAPRNEPQRVEARLEGSRGDAVRLVYNPEYARFPAGRSGGRVDALDLAAEYPGFAPGGDLVEMLPNPLEPKDDKDGVGGASPGKTPRSVVFLRLGQLSRTVAPEERVISLYGHFLDPEAVQDEESGLILRKFQAKSPYEGEDLYFAPPEGSAFAARCAPATPFLPATCLSTMRIGALEVDLRFDKNLLPQWEKLVEGTRALVDSIAAP